MKDRQHFFLACFGEFDGSVYVDWKPGQICYYCGQSVNREDIDIAASYWNITGQGPLWRPSHKACAKTGYREEAFQSQLIDADWTKEACHSYR
jgi:hypothetical protein